VLHRYPEPYQNPRSMACDRSAQHCAASRKRLVDRGRPCPDVWYRHCLGLSRAGRWLPVVRKQFAQPSDGALRDAREHNCGTRQAARPRTACRRRCNCATPQPSLLKRSSCPNPPLMSRLTAIAWRGAATGVRTRGIARLRRRAGWQPAQAACCRRQCGFRSTVGPRDRSG
jgi:hypothetical protein